MTDNVVLVDNDMLLHVVMCMLLLGAVQLVDSIKLFEH